MTDKFNENLKKARQDALADKVTPTDIYAVSAFQNPFQ